jgi:hypothetical protein
VAIQFSLTLATAKALYNVLDLQKPGPRFFTARLKPDRIKPANKILFWASCSKWEVKIPALAANFI